ncbi:alanine--glyoxylate aminotransferase family protein [Spirulina major CS-329]|uniref:pyridoxal-phosphate-dependent aminotransferase family protein n=1 Tax=Spirulina TaxID=1154 RepID=UPI00232AA204|nr:MULTISPECIES: alanine--glyoxylate aminotransferase family protein [Spirulina]MDB9496957.1 alanine--glyoxylate aminotransferase family protein [Spirulina subsalsa CS-330]MDB9502593.1 alanine--glyoxylate aminotransferase family protein [Spirulina major CS-329]
MASPHPLTAPTVNQQDHLHLAPLNIPTRLLLGPGPSNADPAVIAALNRQPIGHLDPAYLQLMDEVQSLLRYTWQTTNPMTLPISGTGSAAMEATLANVVEPGDRVLVGVSGYFGHRLVDMAGRYRADVRTLHKPWGGVFSLAELRTALEECRPQVLALVHAETSTGARQPLEGIGALCREFDCLFLVDTVTSLGAVPLFLDEWNVDLAYSCSQKGLSCPPGISPFTMGPRALAKLDNRSTKVANWYLDMSMLRNYWGNGRVYHHTAPVNMTYAIREALRLLAEEGLEQVWARHQRNAEQLWDGLEALGLRCHVERAYRLPTLTTVRVPDGVDAKAVTRRLLAEYNLEIGNGLGELSGQVWRIGLMGTNSRPENVETVLTALGEVLGR